jgi:AraC-like DNA-binding protein
LRLGADDYIQKPFDVKYLKLKIDNIIANRKIMRSKFLEVNKPADIVEALENDLNVNFITKVTKIAEEHLIDTEFSISDLSREMGMSRSLLYTKFNTITGYSPNDFVKIIRMKKAVALFKEGIHNINEVAALTGFDEPNYFTTCFKKIYGKSPKQFINEEIIQKK